MVATLSVCYGWSLRTYSFFVAVITLPHTRSLFKTTVLSRNAEKRTETSCWHPMQHNALLHPYLVCECLRLHISRLILVGVPHSIKIACIFRYFVLLGPSMEWQGESMNRNAIQYTVGWFGVLCIGYWNRPIISITEWCKALTDKAHSLLRCKS